MKHPVWIINSTLLVLILCALIFVLFSHVSLPEREDIEPSYYSTIKKEKQLQINIGQIYKADLFGTVAALEIEKKEEELFPLPPEPQVAEIPDLPQPQCPVGRRAGRSGRESGGEHWHQHAQPVRTVPRPGELASEDTSTDNGGTWAGRAARAGAPLRFRAHGRPMPESCPAPSRRWVRIDRCEARPTPGCGRRVRAPLRVASRRR